MPPSGSLYFFGFFTSKTQCPAQGPNDMGFITCTEKRLSFLFPKPVSTAVPDTHPGVFRAKWDATLLQ